MARRYSRSKGQAGSTKPSKITKPNWIRYGSNEIELLVTKLAKEGKTPSQIGLFLRDVYGVPNVKAITGKKINELLKEKAIAKKLPEDLTSLLRRIVQLQKHLEKNHKDEVAKRGLTLTESNLKSLVKYYARQDVLPKGWKYERENAALLLK